MWHNIVGHAFHPSPRSPVQKDHLDVHVLAVFVQEVLEEVGDGLVRYVAAHHNVPADPTQGG